MGPLDSEIWVDCRQWSDRWSVEENLHGGGQGSAYRVRRKTDKQLAFLKAIKAKRDPERRRRFFREAATYDTVRANGLPHLIESNANFHDKPGYVPYVATSFIEGPTLQEWRDAQQTVALPVAISTTQALLKTLRMCHVEDVLHRDIKPDNIIMKEGDPLQPILLDFGLSFHALQPAELETEDRQELGNRFLRLPELSAGSSRKRDPRSDLSFAAGICFFMLTGRFPYVLQDAEGRLPHQRSEVLEVLHDTAGSSSTRLLSFFDRGFAPQIADRFFDADEMLKCTHKIIGQFHVASTPNDDLSAIREIFDTSATRQQYSTHSRISEALDQCRRVHESIPEDLKVPMSISQTACSIEGNVGRNTLWWTI
ncbi:MAG: protein kinase, partial [Acidobacteriia bacterium]|nr:protein kinase [Terriglobia bacterium]